MIKQNMKIRSGDEVIVLTGKNKNCVCNVVKVFTKSNKVLLSSKDETFKKNTKHIKKGQNSPGRKEEFVLPIHVSNIAFYHNKKATKLSYKIKEDGKKVRVTRSGVEV